MSLRLDERIQLLRATSLFKSLALENIAALAAVMTEKNFLRDQIILNEGDPAPDFYVITSGEIEVSKLYKNQSVPLALLSVGDTIGLIDEKASETPATASMKTLTPVHTLTLTKAALVSHIQDHPEITLQLKVQMEMIKKENFLRLLTPFKKLPLNLVKDLCNKITTKKVKKDEIILRQGEEGDACYLILSGAVKVFTQERGKTPIATLGIGNLFGEMALLTETNNLRNSTVIADQDCELYEISAEVFRSYLERDEETENMVMFFNTNRSRPHKKSNIEIASYQYTDGEVAYILKNRENHRYVQVSEEGLYFFNLLDGQKTLQEITLLIYEKKGIFIPEQISDLLLKLYKAGMVEGFVILTKIKKNGFWGGAFNLLSRVMTFQVSLKNTDAFISRFYDKFAKFIFSKPASVSILVVIFLGLFFYLENAEHIVSFFQGGKGRYWWLLAVLPLTIFTAGFHELAHAYTCKHFKREVHGFGFGWFWISAIVFCDTTDMWLATKKQRIAVNLAGCINDLTLAGAAAILAVLVRNSLVDIILWLYATVTYLSFVLNLDPISEFDGYYAVMDALDMPDLRQRAAVWLATLPKSFVWSSDTKKILLYWGVCLVYIILIVQALLIFQKKVIFQLLPYDLSSGTQGLIRWILPYFVIFYAGFTILSEVIKQARALSR